MAEWLGRALQKLLQRFESARDLQKQQKAPQKGAFCCLEVFAENNKLHFLKKSYPKPLLQNLNLNIFKIGDAFGVVAL